MDRKLYKLPFQLDSCLDWQCPTCKKGLLRIKKDTFFSDELAHSRKSSNHEAWEPEWDEYIYSCLMLCTNDNCKEVVSSTGMGFVDWDIVELRQGETEQVYSNYYKPSYFKPHLKIIETPEETPSEVNDSLNESFELFFCNPSAAANHVRASVEALLTNLKVKRYETSSGARRPINLHRRINLLPEKYNELKELLIAVKWLGNAGSHAGQELTIDDVMDTYEIMEHILKEIYGKNLTKLKKIATKVNKAKGPKK